MMDCPDCGHAIAAHRAVGGPMRFGWGCSIHDCSCARSYGELRAEAEHRRQEVLGAATDMVNCPPHYRLLKPEPIDVIESWGVNFHIGQVIKYVARAGKKDPAKHVEDLKKAAWYLEREIARVERKRTSSRWCRKYGGLVYGCKLDGDDFCDCEEEEE